MKKFNPVYIAVFLFCAMGAWGCSQQKTGAISAKINELETRYTKLEEDYRTLQHTHDQHRKRLTQLEAQHAVLEAERTELNKQLETVNTERDTLKNQVAQRTQERDTAQTNLTQFSKDLQALVGRVESALNSNSPGANASIIPASRGPSEQASDPWQQRQRRKPARTEFSRACYRKASRSAQCNQLGLGLAS